jgi:hypothetical protein
MTDNNKKQWENELDYYHFMDVETSYAILIKRHPSLKHLCGYVSLPVNHPLYNKSHKENDVFDKFDVHGGVTFTGILDGEHNSNDKLKLFLVGFDCAHAGDFVPEFSEDLVRGDEEYRDINYVILECIKLARQLKNMEDLK